jgi:hypothetical protein
MYEEPVPTPACTGSPHESVVEIMVRGTTLAHPCSVRKTENHSDVVRTERRDIQSPCIKSISDGKERRLESGVPTNEMHDAVPSAPPPTSGSPRNDNGGMARQLEKIRPKEPPTAMAPSSPGARLLACLLPEMGIYRMAARRRVVSRTETPYLFLTKGGAASSATTCGDKETLETLQFKMKYDIGKHQ